MWAMNSQIDQTYKSKLYPGLIYIEKIFRPCIPGYFNRGLKNCEVSRLLAVALWSLWLMCDESSRNRLIITTVSLLISDLLNHRRIDQLRVFVSLFLPALSNNIATKDRFPTRAAITAVKRGWRAGECLRVLGTADRTHRVRRSLNIPPKWNGSLTSTKNSMRD